MSQKQASRLILYAILIVFIFGLLLWSPILSASRPEPSSPLDASTPIQSIRNETLGVQDIFAISLPNRVDKRDNIVLGASVNGFQVELVDATTPDEIDPKTYPYNWNFGHRPIEYAARRSHLNVMQRVLRERLGSAIVMEDDADWDVTATESPYGDDWDVLWLGHCGIECKTDRPYVLTPNDPTILSPNHFLPYWRDPPPLERPDNSRLTCAISDGVCSIVYASRQFDVSLGRLCGSGYLRCFAPYPSLTGGYKAAGSAAKGSGINGPEGKEGAFEPPFSHGVMYSTMLNINRLLAGRRTFMSTWGDVPVREIAPEVIPVIGGTLIVPQAEP
ncbi:glycosyltransferase family 25 protein [Aspergillus undulatus]|uniref:glycosyltransferase family 25 protein n=1 Tax=Aspergillus undulatus TaxID=1810928 RepID=UPI003CCE0397